MKLLTPDRLREHRLAVRLSQLELARRAKVSRFRLHTFEKGGQQPSFTDEEDQRIRDALLKAGDELLAASAEILHASKKALSR